MNEERQNYRKIWGSHPPLRSKNGATIRTTAGEATMRDVQIKAIWKSAINFAANICADESNRANDDDNGAGCEAAEEIRRRILGGTEPDEQMLGDIKAFLETESD